MKKRELINLGFGGGRVLEAALSVCKKAPQWKIKKAALRGDLRELAANPALFRNDPLYGELARMLDEAPPAENYTLTNDLSYSCFGSEIEEGAHRQMKNACSLPVSRAGALMPDAHEGYGLPIGGVLAVENAVIPYAVGVDIACRVMVTVMDIPTQYMERRGDKLERVLEQNTVFGVGGEKKRRSDHPVMGDRWNVSPVTADLKDKAWRQLGTSGSGNHFVEFGEIEFGDNDLGVEAGRYTALVSHSGSRGPGAAVANYYSRLAGSLRRGLPKYLKHLAWLDMDSEGAEYWAAMELMGRYASANHHIIHEDIISALQADVVFQIENHHNFAWKEKHFGKEVIVHRKGATPAHKGTLGYIPGSMTAPGYLVEGKGEPASLSSCAHGAGRAMSRKAAKNSITRHQLEKILKDKGVTLLSAGLDESPHAYKDIESVMRCQAALVDKIARFIPRIVKMAPEEKSRRK